MRSLPSAAVAVGVAGAAALQAGAAAAFDWSLRSFFAQRFEATDSGSGGEGSAGEASDEAAARSITDLGLLIAADDGRTELTFAPGLRGTLATDQDIDAATLLPRFNGAAARSFSSGRAFASVDFVPSLTDGEDADDPLFGEDDGLPSRTTSESALELLLSGEAGFTYLVGPADTLTATASGRVREFSGDVETLTPSRAYGADLSWRRSVDRVTGVSVTGGAERFSSDAGPSSTSSTLTLGLDRRLTALWSGSVSAGASLVAEDGGDEVLVGAGEFALDYLGRRTSLRLFGGQRLDQDDSGEVASRLVLGGSLGHRLTARRSLGLTAQLNAPDPLFSPGGDDDGTVFTLAPELTVGLTEDWEAGFGYRLRVEEEDDPLSHLVFLRVSWGLALLP